MIIILISFLNLSLRGVSHAEGIISHRGTEGTEGGVVSRRILFLTQRRGGRRSTQRKSLTQRNRGNGGAAPGRKEENGGDGERPTVADSPNSENLLHSERLLHSENILLNLQMPPRLSVR